MELHLRLRPDDGVPLSDPTRYCHLVGSLVYLTITRPDIAYAVHVLSQFVSAPTSMYYYAHLLRLLCYLRATPSRGLFFSSSSFLSFGFILMLRGPVTQLIVVLSLAFVCS